MVIIKWIFLIHIFFFTIVTLQVTLPDVLQYLSISPIVVYIFADYPHVYWNKPDTIAIARQGTKRSKNLTVKPKESLNKKHKIRNNAQSLLKETTRQKKGNVLSNISFTISGKILERLFNVDPWFLKTTLTFSFFFRSHSYSNSRRCLWGDHQCKVSGYWSVYSVLKFIFYDRSPLTPPNQKYEVRNNHRKRRPRWRRIQVLSKMIIMTSMFYHSRRRSC